MDVKINESAWKYVLDKANASTLASLPEKEKAAFVPVILEDYIQARIDELGASYARQKAQDLANDPVNAARILKILSANDEVRAEFAAQIDALP